MVWSDQLKQLWGNLLALGPRRLAALGLVGFTVFVAVGLGSYFLSRPDYETLYAGLESQDVSRIGMQKDFAKSLIDTLQTGVGQLVDADMNEESTRLQALQVKQQLGIQALSIANASSQSILRLFQ